MNIQELGTIMQFQPNVKIIILNNNFLGMVRQWQESFHGNRRSASVFTNHPDFIKLAEAYGIKGTKLSNPATFEAELEEAFTYKGPQLIEVVVSSSEHVLPMIPSGMPNHKMIGVKGQ